jgi:hypothetical protein
MVLEARDYGFIGLKLKGLIFHEGGNQRASQGYFIGWKENCEENVGWRLISCELRR